MIYDHCLVKLESYIYGLLYIPDIEPTYSNSADYIDEVNNPKIEVAENNGNGQFSNNNFEKVLEEFNKVKETAKCIVEIGVARKFEKSSTDLWLNNKIDDCHYFGIDIDMNNKMHYEDHKPNVHLLGMNSKTEKDKILDKMKEYGCEQIDVLFIDGDHSLDLVLNDWKYSELVRSGGLIIFHDTNIHPGPYLVFDAIDDTLFEKNKYFYEENNDWGLAVVRKK